MTPNAPITGIGNIILLVRDMERSLAFYRDAVGLDVRASGAEFAFLQAGAVTLCLRQPARAPQGEDEGRVEIVFDVPDIQAAYETLKARGVVFRVEPRVVTGSNVGDRFSRSRRPRAVNPRPVTPTQTPA